ncbi:PREDICTED: general transcription factor 3C polypeptide 6-like [Priapulus caudatus]|uniref:General transcription factor 3C polypeptide 6-like n=1 Tax=Priapulus caudatus TaxID=37621 RepID=A0ABM1EEE7_PRICU|nr:PREDICTED: general transcription factor 3C polypeptide 6-like [Priapulus caudatus]
MADVPAGGCGDSDSDYEVDEEAYVLLELSGIIDSDYLKKCEPKCKVLGLDRAKPIVQVGRHVFAGKFEDTVGTAVFFSEEQQGGANTAKQLSYFTHTSKKLCVQRAFLSEKAEPAAAAATSSAQINGSTEDANNMEVDQDQSSSKE